MKLVVEDLRVAYGRTDVLFGVSFEVGDDDFVCLMGRNGVGKTTLLNAVMGVLPARSGACCSTAATSPSCPRTSVPAPGSATCPQGHQVFPQLTVAENLRVVHERVKGGDRAAIDDALDVFPALRQLLRPPGRSAERRAGAAARDRAGARDPAAAAGARRADRGHPAVDHPRDRRRDRRAARGAGMSILLVEQYVEFALRLADRYAVMDRGVIVHDGHTDDADMDTFADLLAV